MPHPLLSSESCAVPVVGYGFERTGSAADPEGEIPSASTLEEQHAQPVVMSRGESDRADLFRRLRAAHR